MSIRITTLGRLQVSRGDSVITALPSQRLRCALLVYLAVTRETSRDRLLSMFWAEKSERQARHALSQNIYELRAVLGEDWVAIRGEQVVVAGHVTIDLLAFGEAADREDAQAALSLYRGFFLDGFILSNAPAFDSWVEAQRLRAQRQHRRARRDWITRLSDQARIRDALLAAREWVAIDPTDDEAQHRLLELLVETGDRAGAIRQFEAYERQLQADDLTPLDETRQLVDRIRAGEAGTLPSPPVSMSAPRPAGHSLRVDLPAPEPPPAPVPDVMAPVDSPAVRRTARRMLAVALIVVLLGAVGFLTTLPEAPAGPVAPVRHNVAVLYFDDLSPDSSAAQLSRAITERLIDELRQAGPQLVVRSRHATFPYIGGGVAVDSIARALDAGMLVGGSIIQADGEVRVTVELLDAAGVVVASHTITGRKERYLALIDTVVAYANETVRRQMGVHLRLQQLRMGASDERAYAAVMRATTLYDEARQIRQSAGTAPAFELVAQAEDLLQDAARADPRWSGPVVLRARLEEYRGLVAMDDRDAARSLEHLRAGIDVVSDFITRNPRNVEALETRAQLSIRLAGFPAQDAEMVRQYRVLALNDLNQVIQLEPDRAEAWSALAGLTFELGNYGSARFAASRALALDAFLSTASATLYSLALSEFELGDDEEAARLCDEGLRKYADDRFVTCALHLMAFSDVVPADVDRAWEIAHTGGGHPIPLHEMLVAGVLTRTELRDSAAAVLDRAAAREGNSAAVHWIEPVLRHRLGQNDRAQEQLARFIRSSPRTQRTLASRALRPLRAEPRIGEEARLH